MFSNFAVVLAVVLSASSHEKTGFDPEALKKDGWKRELYQDKDKQYFLYKKGKKELFCYIQNDCGSVNLNDCVSRCKSKEAETKKAITRTGAKPRLLPRLASQKLKQQVTTAPIASVPTPPQNQVLHRADGLIHGFTKACYIDQLAVLGDFQGVAYEKYAIFQNGTEFYSCEVVQSDECSRIAGKSTFFGRCVKVGSCIQNFRGSDTQTPHCRP